MSVIDRDLAAFAYIVRRIREETAGANEWDEAGVYAKVAELKGRHFWTSLEQVMRHAADPTAKTPGAIHRTFLPDKPAPQHWTPTKKGEECRKHAGQYRNSCGGCASEAQAADREETAVASAEPLMPQSAAKASARAALAMVCPHRLRPVACAICRTTTTEPEDA